MSSHSSLGAKHLDSCSKPHFRFPWFLAALNPRNTTTYEYGLKLGTSNIGWLHTVTRLQKNDPVMCSPHFHLRQTTSQSTERSLQDLMEWSDSVREPGPGFLDNVILNDNHLYNHIIHTIIHVEMIWISSS